MAVTRSDVAEPEWPEGGLRTAIELLAATQVSRLYVVDVGAHHGETMSTVQAAVELDCDYLALEPNPDACTITERVAVRLTSDRFHTTVRQVAAGREPGRATLLKTKASAVAGLLAPTRGLDARVPSGDHHVLERIDVPIVTVDAVVREQGWPVVDLLKIDAEGYDLEVLRGAVGLLREGRARVVLAEVFFVAYREGQAYFWDIAAFLGDCGYLFVNLFDTRETQQGRLYTGNGLWVSPEVANLHGFL